ncbi:MAG: response regulator transcription factor [Myxococcota bacterium]|nr:response regulator transcription factor [Myxococcota bacterium]
MRVRVLVVGPGSLVERADGAAAVLRDLGCHVESVDLWDPIDRLVAGRAAPSVVVVEALDEIDAGRAALMRLRAVEALQGIPVLLGVTVGALPRLAPGDGFDDFALAPYVAPELYARIRRVQWARSFDGRERVRIGALCVDLAAHEVFVDGRPVDLTHQEFALLAFLITHRGRVFTREQLLSRVWRVEHYHGSRTVDIHVRRLRAKLGPAAAPLETVRGVGYKMRET